MAGYQDPLSRVKVASPCTADWESMLGNERQRFCGQCQLNVYNLSGMSKREAENLISHAEGRLCVRFYRRADGTILTKDCPVGLRALKRRFTRLRNAVVSTALSFFAGLGLHAAASAPEQQIMMGVRAIGEIPARQPEPLPVDGYMIMGDIAVEEPQPKPVLRRNNRR
jgi:hypothetical protein